MKKRITTYLLIAVAMTLLTISCQKNERTFDGSAKDVSISIALPGNQIVKSQDNPGDGTMINRCILEIYQDGTLYGERMSADISSLSADFIVRLTTGNTYTFVFWADCAEGNAADGFTDTYYNTSDGLTSISLIPEAYGNSNDMLDAFYGSFSQQVDGDMSFTLKRPFGQLNIFTLDAAASGIDMSNLDAKVSFSEVPAGFNALDGSISSDRIQITPAAFSASVNKTTAGEPDETQLTFDYLFAAPGADETLIDFTLELQVDGSAVCPPYEASNIPVRRNYRTNVKSDFITSGTNITIEINPGFDDDSGLPEPIEVTAANASVDYYGTSNGTTNANYILSLSDYMGRSFILDLYGTESEELPSGTYMFSDDADAINTFFSENSYIAEWSTRTGGFTAGTLTVNKNGETYEITLEAQTEEENYLVTFNGSLEFNDLTVPPTGFESDVAITDAKVYLYYNGVKGNMYNMSVEINDFNNTGYNVYLNMLTGINAEGEIPAGTYNVSSDSDINTVLVGQNTYARFTDTDTYISNDAPIISGSVTVTESNITGTVTVQGGRSVTFSTAGLPSYSDLGRFPTPGTNVGENVNLTYSGDVNAYGYAYDDYWHITIAPTYMNDGPALNLDLATGAPFEDGFDGTYSCSNSGAAYTFPQGSAYVNGTDYDNWGVVYYYSSRAMHTGTYATISGGTITVTENSREVINEWGDEVCNCDIVLNGIDPDGNSINVTYENIKINIYNNSGSSYYNF